MRRDTSQRAPGWWRVGWLVAVVAQAGCSLPAPPPSCDGCVVCAPARQRADGVCCPAWTRAVAGDCVVRRWEVGAPLGNSASAPNLALLSDGSAAVAWVETVDLQSSGLVVAELAGDTRVSAASAHLPGRVASPRLAAGPAERALLTWQQVAPSGAFIMRSERSAGLWRHPQSLGEAVSFAPDAYEPEILIGSDGEALHCWNQWMSPGYGVALARRGSHDEGFEGPAHVRDVLSPDLLFSNAPFLARNDRGDALVTWYQSVGGPLVTFVSERHGEMGAFSRPDPAASLSPADAPLFAPVENPEAALAADGRAAVVWRQELAEGMAVFLATRSAGGVWQSPADIDETFSLPVDLAIDTRVGFAAEHLYVVWRADSGDDRAIYLAHRTPDGDWLAAGAAPLRLSSDVPAIEPQLVVGRDGGVAVAYTRLDDDGWKIVVRRSSTSANQASEAERWTPEEVVSAGGSGANASSPSLAVAGPNDDLAVAFQQAGRVVVSRFVTP